MSERKVSLHPNADAEALAADRWYLERSAQPAAEFSRQLDVTIEKILRSPETWAEAYPKIRRCRLLRFPYAIYYQVRANEILALAVAHAKRKPGYWQQRVSS